MKIECDHTDGRYVRADVCYANGSDGKLEITIDVYDDVQESTVVMEFTDAEDAEALARQLLECVAQLRKHERREKRAEYELRLQEPYGE